MSTFFACALAYHLFGLFLFLWGILVSECTMQAKEFLVGFFVFVGCWPIVAMYGAYSVFKEKSL